MEVTRCPNPKCRRRILDDEGTETEWTVLEIKCQHCGKLVRLHFGPEGYIKNRSVSGFTRA